MRAPLTITLVALAGLSLSTPAAAFQNKTLNSGPVRQRKATAFSPRQHGFNSRQDQPNTRSIGATGAQRVFTPQPGVQLPHGA